MKNIQKATFAQLRKKYLKVVNVNNDLRHLDQFSKLQHDIHNELEHRQRAAIFNYCTHSGCLKLPDGWTNYFQFCAHFADSCMDDTSRFADDESYEIGSFYCKNHNPHVVQFD